MIPCRRSLVVALMAVGLGACSGSVVEGGSDAGSGAGSGNVFGVDIDAPRPSLAPDSPTVHCYNAQGVACLEPSPPPPDGEDGQVRVRVPTYTVKGDTLTDSVTKLTWQLAVAPGVLTWQQAVQYCAGLQLDGASDFRLPTRLELETLVDFGVSFDQNMFPPELQEPHSDPLGRPTCLWSRTGGNGAGKRWQVCPVSGGNWYAAPWYFNESSVGSVRCVRGPVIKQRFVISKDGKMAFDESTGLVWWREPFQGEMGWWEAISACENASLDGLNDWRLPSVKELNSLVDLSQGQPTIDASVFPHVQPEPYWSSTYVRDGVDDAWAVTFGDMPDTNGVRAGAWASFLPGGGMPHLCVRH